MSRDALSTTTGSLSEPKERFRNLSTVKGSLSEPKGRFRSLSTLKGSRGRERDLRRNSRRARPDGALHGTLEEVLELEAILPDRVRPLRRAEYDKLIELGMFENEKIELLYGALVRMSPIGPPHSSAVQALTELLVVALLGRAAVRVQLPFAALDDSEPEPDVAVVPPGRYDTEHPGAAWLLIEVAESSLAIDRGLKKRLYAQAGVSEYWIVNVIDRQIEIFREPADGDYGCSEIRRKGESVRLSRFPDVEIRVDDVLR